jgi:hypothetical protein
MGSPEAQENIVGNVSRDLADGGLLILVEYNPVTRRIEDKKEEKLYRWMVSDPDNNRALFYWRTSSPSGKDHEYAMVTYAIECVEWNGRGLTIESFPMTLRIHYNSPTQLDALLTKHGLTLEKRMGYPNTIAQGKPDYLPDESHSQEVIARKTQQDEKL